MKRFVPILVLFLVACSLQNPEAPVRNTVLTVMTHDSFSVSQEVVEAFERDNGASISFVKSGDAGAALNRAILTKESPLADVFFGVDNTFLTRALDAEIFEAYDSPLLKQVPAEFRLDPENQALPIDYGDVCLNYDRSYFSAHGLEPPQTLEALAEPQFRGMLVVENPASSSPGLAFLLLTVKHFGDPGYLEFWKALRQNEATVVDGWETAYYVNFSASSGKGPQPLVVSYATSPAAEVIYAPTPLQEAPTAAILGPDTCFRQIEYAGILKGSQNPDLARRFIDFLLGPEFQADVPLQMFVYPVRADVDLPEAFTEFAPSPAAPASLPPRDIALNREAWIKAWAGVMLR